MDEAFHVVMRANVMLRVGMRLVYTPPTGTDLFVNEYFYEQHRGMEATIVGFASRPAAPLDREGHLQGTAHSPQNIDIRFDGEAEIHRGLSLAHFTLLDSLPTATGDSLTREPRAIHEITLTRDTQAQGCGQPPEGLVKFLL